MAEKNLKSILPTTEEISLEAQNADPDNIHRSAFRRGKVRELTRMGYEPHQIVEILKKGVKVGKSQKKVIISISKQVIQNDINYLRQEDLSQDVDFTEKRAEILDKLRFLYNRAISEYLNAKGSIRNSFMNTALTILGKIVEIEGIKSPEGLNVNLGSQAKISKYATEIHKLNEDDKITIINAVRKVLKQRQPERIGDTGVSSQPSRIPISASNNEGVSRKS